MGLFSSIGEFIFGGKFSDAIDASADDLMRLKFEELRSVARPLFKGANQRYKRLDELNLVFTPALDAVDDGGGKFYIGKFQFAEQLNSLRAEVFRAQEFVRMKTSTQSEANKYDARIKEILGAKDGVPVSREDGTHVWELYRMAEQENFAGIQVYGSDNLAQIIFQSMEDMDDEQVLTYVRDVLRESYETAQEEMEEALASEADGFSMFF